MRLWRFRFTLLCGLLLFAMGTTSVYGAIPGNLRTYATRHSIGIEWDISNDDNHNAECSLEYRQSGNQAASWKSGLPLFRVDYKGYNMLAGSLFYLTPGQNYEIRLQLSDVDGGNTTQLISVSTLPLPVGLKQGKTLYVVPGSGGGSGTQADPYRGIDTAQAFVAPGDVVLLGAGTYVGESEFDVSGRPGNYITWKARGNGKAILETIRVNGDYLWFEDLDVSGHQYGIRTYGNPVDVVITKNRFTGCNYCIYLNHGGTAWYIADNVIVGDVDPASGSFQGEGIELDHSDGHTVMYNSISKVADGVSYPGKNCDIFGNDIFDVSDDGIEPDYGTVNNRIYGNRISNAYHNGISFQPMNGAPWYIMRNQVAAPVESALKFRDSVDRALIAHNTFVGWQGVQKSGSSFLLSVQSNNNLWISMTPWYAWENGSGGTSDWRTNLDYDGFDWENYQYGFKWGQRYTDLQSFSQATGLQQHGIKINKNSCFTSLNIPNSPPAPMPKQYFTLKSGCNAIDKGVVLPNVNDGYIGSAPDLGAYEKGAALPHYGPRTNAPPPPPPPPNPGGVRVIPSLTPLLFD